MAWLIQTTWTWANSRRRWGTGKPGVLQSLGLQNISRDLATKHHHHQLFPGTLTTCCSSRHVHLSAQGQQKKQRTREVRLQRRWYQGLLSQHKQGGTQEPEKPLTGTCGSIMVVTNLMWKGVFSPKVVQRLSLMSMQKFKWLTFWK